MRRQCHGRTESGTLQVATVSPGAGQGLLFLHAVQALPITAVSSP